MAGAGQEGGSSGGVAATLGEAFGDLGLLADAILFSLGSEPGGTAAVGGGGAKPEESGPSAAAAAKLAAEDSAYSLKGEEQKEEEEDWQAEGQEDGEESGGEAAAARGPRRQQRRATGSAAAGAAAAAAAPLGKRKRRPTQKAASSADGYGDEEGFGGEGGGDGAASAEPQAGGSAPAGRGRGRAAGGSGGGAAAAPRPRAKKPKREPVPLGPRKWVSSEISLEILEREGCFDMTQWDATRHLGFGSATVLKHLVMPRLGLADWPYRKRETMRVIVKQLEDYMERYGYQYCPRPKVDLLLAHVRGAEAAVRAAPTVCTPLTKEMTALRQRLYKLKNMEQTARGAAAIPDDKWEHFMQHLVNKSIQDFGL